MAAVATATSTQRMVFLDSVPLPLSQENDENLDVQSVTSLPSPRTPVPPPADAESSGCSFWCVVSTIASKVYYLAYDLIMAIVNIFRSRPKDLSDRVSQLETELGQAQTEASEGKKRIELLQTELGQVAEAGSSLHKQNQTLCLMIQQLEGDLQTRIMAAKVSKDNEIAALQGEVTQLKADVKTEQDARRVAEAQAKSAQPQLPQMQRSTSPLASLGRMVNRTLSPRKGGDASSESGSSALPSPLPNVPTPVPSKRDLHVVSPRTGASTPVFRQVTGASDAEKGTSPLSPPPAGRAGSSSVASSALPAAAAKPGAAPRVTSAPGPTAQPPVSAEEVD